MMWFNFFSRLSPSPTSDTGNGTACFVPRELETDLVEDRAEIFVMDPLGHLRNNFLSQLGEVK
jgi:hypothetical protein